MTRTRIATTPVTAGATRAGRAAVAAELRTLRVAVGRRRLRTVRTGPVPEAARRGSVDRTDLARAKEDPPTGPAQAVNPGHLPARGAPLMLAGRPVAKTCRPRLRPTVQAEPAEAIAQPPTRAAHSPPVPFPEEVLTFRGVRTSPAEVEALFGETPQGDGSGRPERRARLGEASSNPRPRRSGAAIRILGGRT